MRWGSRGAQTDARIRSELRCCYLKGQGGLVSRLIMGIIGITMWSIRVINILTKSPLPSK